MPVSFVVRLIAWLWLGAAAAASYFLVLRRLPPLALTGISLTLAALTIAAALRIPPLRRWIESLDLRALVLIHVSRFVGVYFLFLHQRGDLPRAFAVPAGIGDVIVATMALPVALAPLADAPRRRAIVIWNVVGFVSALLALVTMTRLNFSEPSLLVALTRLPLSLYPTFLLPLLLAIHVILFVRTGANSESGRES